MNEEHIPKVVVRDGKAVCEICGSELHERPKPNNICPKCGSETNPLDTCVGCKWRYQQTVTKCWDCIRTITIDGQHEPNDEDYYEHECGHESKQEGGR